MGCRCCLGISAQFMCSSYVRRPDTSPSVQAAVLAALDAVGVFSVGGVNRNKVATLSPRPINWIFGDL